MARIAACREKFDSNPSHYDGYEEKRRKRAVDFTVNGKLYTANTHGVLCSRRVLEDGKTWYSFCATGDELFEKMSDESAFIESLSINRDAKGLIFR